MKLRGQKKGKTFVKPVQCTSAHVRPAVEQYFIKGPRVAVYKSSLFWREDGGNIQVLTHLNSSASVMLNCSIIS